MKLILFHTFFFGAISIALSLDPQIQKIIDTVIEKTFIPHHHITGLGLAIVKDNGNGTSTFMTKGYGYSDLENGFPFNNDTIFAIGSVSKSFTATLVVKTLHEKFPELGESALDVPIRTLCPTSNFTLIDRFRSESTSLRDLLSHKLCVSPLSFAYTFGVFKNKQELIYRQRYAEEICPFRTNYVYGGGIFMASEVIAEIANSTFEDMLTDLFRQIGMNDTTFVRNSDDYDNMPNISRGYYRRNNVTKQFNRELLKRVSIEVGAGGVLTTSNDIAKYMMFHLNNGKVGSLQIIPEYIRRSSNLVLFRSAKTRPDQIVDGDTAYGLAMGVGLFDGWERLSHGGYMAPFEGLLSLYPALKLGIYTVSNGPGSLIDQDAGHSHLHKQIFDIIQKGVNYDSSANISYTTSSAYLSSSFAMPTISTIPKNKTTINRVEAEDIVGVYGNGLSGELNITLLNAKAHEEKKGDLYFQFGTWGTGIMTRRSNTSFVIDFDSDVVHDFYASETPEMEVVLDFSETNFAIVHLGEEKLTYERDLTLDKLPAQPWESNSCGSSFWTSPTTRGDSFRPSTNDSLEQKSTHNKADISDILKSRMDELKNVGHKIKEFFTSAPKMVTKTN